MKKAIRNVILGATCATMVLSIAGTGCTGDKKDPEKDPVAIALGSVDENFNPFVYTSANDGEVIGLTQISMLSSDANGNVVCGNNEATLALDYSVTEVGEGDDTDTVYEFLIKKGVKDSQGYDIGIKDALFNLYVYLDPVYSGSSTIYSTKIKGLAKYRAQDDTIPDDADDSVADTYRSKVSARIAAIREYDEDPTADAYDKVKDDIKTVSELFRKQLESDWTALQGTVKTSYKDYRFTEDWEVFLYEEGIIGNQYFLNSNNKAERLKDANGKYLTYLDAAVETQPGKPGTMTTGGRYVDRTGFYEEFEQAADKKALAIDKVFDTYFYVDGDDVDQASTDSIAPALDAVGAEVQQKFLNEAMTEANNKLENGLAVNSISGITTRKTNTFKNKNLGSEYDVLTIEINGIDPAAIYNFAFTVAPMHYYSGTYKGTDYVARADQYADEKVDNRFGVCFRDTGFFEDVIDAPSKKHAPVGAGAYKMIENGTFWNSSRAAYERNTYFTTLGDGIENAKIKYLNYQVTSDDQILNSLISGGIHYGQPNCTQENINALNGQKHLTSAQYQANGFGYVGINPTYVKKLEVRQAIMLAMNPQKYIVGNYYNEGKFASMLYRPTSKTSFITQYDYNDELNTPYKTQKNLEVTYKYDNNTVGAKIDELVAEAGYTLKNGILTNSAGETLKFTFTIAGETQDHPAWNMFVDASNTLNSHGFDITVKTDRNALVQLATGKLQVWAAAWSSGIDPDMYQVYHKDSNATAVKNWGYPSILNDEKTYSREQAILTEMSEYIDAARKTNDKQKRTENYLLALGEVMELAVELPTYQRNDLAVYNNTVIDENTLNKNASANAGLLYRIWELNFVK